MRFRLTVVAGLLCAALVGAVLSAEHGVAAPGWPGSRVSLMAQDEGSAAEQIIEETAAEQTSEEMMDWGNVEAGGAEDGAGTDEWTPIEPAEATDPMPVPVVEITPTPIIEVTATPIVIEATPTVVVLAPPEVPTTIIEVLTATPTATRLTLTPTVTPTGTRAATATVTMTPRPTSTPVPPVGGGGATTSGSVPVPTPVAVVDSGVPSSGGWSGTTSQGRPISFSVQGNTITSLSVGYMATGSGGCTSFDGQISVGFSSSGDTAAPQINGGSFQVAGGSPPVGAGPQIVAGSFDSSTSASGTVSVSAIVMTSFLPCASTVNATWTARKS